MPDIKSKKEIIFIAALWKYLQLFYLDIVVKYLGSAKIIDHSPVMRNEIIMPRNSLDLPEFPARILYEYPKF